MRSLPELCGLRVSAETYMAPKAPLQCKRCQRFGHTQRNCRNTPRCVACGEPHPSGECSTPRKQLKCCSCGVTTQPTTGAVQSGWRLRPRLQSGRQLLASTRTVQLSARLQRKRHAPSFLQSRRAQDLNGLMWCEGGGSETHRPIWASDIFSCKQLAYTCHGQYVFHIVTVTSVVSQVMKFTLTGFTVLSLYYPQITHITTIKVMAVIIQCHVSFFVPRLCVSSWHL